MSGNGGARAWELLRQEARATGSDVQALATDYVIERLMERLSSVDDEGIVAVKGGQSLGLLMANRMRPTKDLDINVEAHHEDADAIDRTIELIKAACSCQRDDGVTFDLDGIDIERREHQGEGGLRITVPAGIHTSRVPFVIDVGIGNEMTYDPTSITTAGVLGGRKSAPAPLEVLVYPLENTLAEKLVSKFEDGAASIRHKDFFDLWLLHEVALRLGDLSLLTIPIRDLDENDRDRVAAVKEALADGSLFDRPVIGIAETCRDRLGVALRRTASHRGTAIPDDVIAYLRDEFASDRVQSTQWANWCTNNAKRLRFAPPGTRRGEDRAGALSRLIEDMGPFLEEIAIIARGDPTPGAFGR